MRNIFRCSILSLFVLGVVTLASPSFTTTRAKTRQGEKTAANLIPGNTFSNFGLITINDVAVATPYPSSIGVSGLAGTITGVSVTLNGFSHTFPGDVGMVLVGPTGAAFLAQDGAGSSPVSNVTYSLADFGAAQLPENGAWAAGTFQPTSFFNTDNFPTPGPGTTYSVPAPAGTATFATVFNGTAPNGLWNLYVADFESGDVGTISNGWSITITTSGGAIHTQHVLDFNGDGKTDYAVVRNTGGGASGQATWFIQNNGVAGGQTAPFGLASDQFVSGDFDGDGKADIAVWRDQGSNSAFYILQSQTSTLRAETFGLSGDFPDVVGDYNGDGKTDIAVYRPGATAGAQSFWFYRTTQNGPTFVVPWGQNGDFPAPGDYDGDGKNDFVVQRADVGGQGRFWTMLATGAVSSTQFGLSTDVIVPGDYDGDGKTDLAVVRGQGGQIVWYYLPSGGGPFVQTTFGLAATDSPVQGDYDGDGKTDIAVWRPNADPTQNFFWVLQSGNGSVTQFEWGQSGDFPVANFNVH
jgi:hypothetical protein